MRSDTTISKQHGAAIAEILKEIKLEECWYKKMESHLQEEEVMDTAACCHGIKIGGGTSSSMTSLGAMRNCRQCGFIL